MLTLTEAVCARLGPEPQLCQISYLLKGAVSVRIATGVDLAYSVELAVPRRSVQGTVRAC